MSICENIDPDKILALPPLTHVRVSDPYLWCLIDERTPTENNNYKEQPLVPIELPDRNEFNKMHIPPKGIYVIPYDRPTTILIANEIPFLKKVVKCRTQKNGSTLPFSNRKGRYPRIFHSFLTSANPVIAAGQYKWDDNKNLMTIDNQSGHYIPPSSVMDYAKCLFEKKGYNTTVNIIANGFTRTEITKKSLRPLSYWLSTPVSEWYSKEKQGGKSKKRGKTLKKRRHT